MKLNLLYAAIIMLLLTVGTGGCSKEEPNYEDCFSSIISGEYEKDGPWKLYVYENGKPLDNYGYVRFDSKLLEKADFRFVNILPGESTREFRDIPLVETQEGYTFRIDYVRKKKKIIISGIVTFGEMKVDLKTN